MNKEHQEQARLMKAPMLWTLKSAENIASAGGDPRGVMLLVSEELLSAMVRNNIFMTYVDPRQTS